jgi:hypothetical protein|tara:strand:+ start:1168 stop:1962 length:795 start_codon:yes stop_codon:yes gene_type:complete
MIPINKFVDNLDLGEGETVRLTCPTCGGKNTFTASKDGGIVMYNCYKLDCSIRGAVTTGMTAQEIRKRMQGRDTPVRKEFEPMPYPEYVVNPTLEHGLLTKFIKRWDLTNEDILYDVKDRRAVFSIKHQGCVIDAVGRALDGAIPKWFRYTGNAAVYKRVLGTPNGICIVVEDVISAIAVAQIAPNTTGVAILGTSLSPAQMEHIADFYKVIIALDPDAMSKTLAFKQEVEAWTGKKVKALRLDDDIKYKLETDQTRLKEMIND